MMIITASNVVEIAETLFPGFIDEEYRDLPTVVYASLSDDLKNAISSEDTITINKFVSLCEHMAVSHESSVMSCLSELVLGLYAQHDRTMYKLFYDRLNKETKEEFDVHTKLWDKQGRPG